MADDMHYSDNNKPAGRRPLFLFLVGFAVLFVVVVLAGWIPRHLRTAEIDSRAKQEREAKPVVQADTVKAAKSTAAITLPGTTIPMTEAYVYARSSGYLKKYYVDIGAHVKAGQLLAVVDAPDLDAQVAQAREQVAQAEQQLAQQKSQLTLATATVQRYRVLVGKGVFSRQDGDTQEANYSSQVANVAAAQRNVEAFQANLQRVVALQSYERVTAPFAGVITQRNVDVGALISANGSASSASSGPAPQGQSSSAGGTSQAGQSNNAGASGSGSGAATSAQTPGQGGPLFAVSDVKRLRILVSVPESSAGAIHVGELAPVSFQEMPGAKLTAEVTRTAESIDPNTRTMLTELQIDNTDGKLIAGMYVTVNFPPATGVAVQGGPITINGDAIAIRHDKPMVATLVDGKVHFVPVTIGRDYGNSVEILTGLKPGDVIVTQVNDNVVEGAAVTVQGAQAGR
jgi:multidrug efflux pump subunit AcrA (membrane-fusion protein)